MDRVFVREEIEKYYGTEKQRQKIGILGMCSGAGSTFMATGISLILTRANSGRVTYVSAGEYLKSFSSSGSKEIFPRLYDALAMEKRFSLREYIDVFKESEKGKNIRGIQNIDEGINWVLVKGENSIINDVNQTKYYGDESSKNLLRVINNISGDYVIVDFGAVNDEKMMNDILVEMDQIIFVIDPMPSKLMAGFYNFSLIRRWEFQGNKVTYIVNKMCPAVSKREMENYLKIKKYLTFDSLPLELFYEAEYRCKIPVSNKKIFKELGTEFEKLHIAIT